MNHEPNSQPETSTNQPRSRVKLWFRIGLIAFIVIELFLYYLIQRLGWNQTGDVLLLSCACVVIATPALFVIAILVRNKLRFGIRSLLFFMVCAAAFFWITAIPFWQFKKAREGTLMLLEAKIRVERPGESRFLSLIRYLDEPRRDLLESPVVPKPLFWISPFVKDLARIPEHRFVQSIWIRGDAEYQLFLKHHRAFEGLVDLHLMDLGDESYHSLKEILPQHKHFQEICCHSSEGKYPPQFWEMLRVNQIPMLGLTIVTSNSGEPTLPKDMSEWDFLRIVTLHTPYPRNVAPPQVNDDDAETLCRCKQLRFLETYRMKFGPETNLQESLPKCTVFVH